MLWPVRWLLYTHCPGGDEDEARHQRLVEEAERRVECERRVERESGGAESASAPITAPTAEAMSEGHPNMEGTAVHHIRVEEAIEEDSKAEDEKWVALNSAYGPGGMQVLTTAPARVSPQVGRSGGEEVP